MNRPKIAIVDYGMANLRSVQKAFEAVGAAAVITSDAGQIADAAKVVLPGVGAFQDAIARLRETGLGEVITAHVRSGRPFLGICLGLQMLFSRGHEDGLHAGLDLFPGDVVRFTDQPGLKVPHIGWNTLDFTRSGCPLFADLPPDPAVYFVHSYYAVPTDSSLVVATSDYPTPFCAAIWRDNVFATQFHPEKSQDIGLAMLRNFAKL
ncbi:imidazole glycerol phosphate synthase subunit HisH [Fimbriiglobus ruber]|uniref:Imidazole glycerol phosphate synthase subunit HisH n=1 Tax=Fimbriiglobus ruber TaxID=1908690 RepID=A0A225DPT2_9BACT|nr:imidazole glycerol phosphate synthase subunit HisH [Fimbriiglobus ruber]OWK43402.1 Imidazole glycerol phosphate synthase amidotransferase subunit [Fimbriiglobus ruber]